MPTDLRIVVPNRPGSTLEVFEAIGGAGVNVDGMCGDLRRGETWGYVHVLTEDAPGARSAVERAGFQVDAEQQVEAIEIEDRPGAIAEALKPFRDAGRNLCVLYMASRTRVVLGSEDMREERLGVRMSDA
ncbi:MAG: hypothetical protein ACR2LG_07055 [Actinomycetota bacterium]